MSLYAIGDLHLSLGCSKPMDVFGGRWENYVEKLREGLSIIKPGDTTVLCGDLTWGLNLEQAEKDFEFISNIPGRKIILKGNHDYWWSTANKAYTFFREKGFEDIFILNNNSYEYGDFAICGTRGWFYEEEKDTEHDAKMLRRELMRLETSLKSAGDKEKIVFLHYPPKLVFYECSEIINMLRAYDVKKCFFGHLHSAGINAAFLGDFMGIDMKLISADFLNFYPYRVM